jgi:hypothetical protein
MSDGLKYIISRDEWKAIGRSMGWMKSANSSDGKGGFDEVDEDGTVFDAFPFKEDIVEVYFKPKGDGWWEVSFVYEGDFGAKDGTDAQGGVALMSKISDVVKRHIEAYGVSGYYYYAATERRSKIYDWVGKRIGIRMVRKT